MPNIKYTPHNRTLFSPVVVWCQLFYPYLSGFLEQSYDTPYIDKAFLKNMGNKVPDIHYGVNSVCDACFSLTLYRHSLGECLWLKPILLWFV